MDPTPRLTSGEYSCMTDHLASRHSHVTAPNLFSIAADQSWKMVGSFAGGVGARLLEICLYCKTMKNIIREYQKEQVSTTVALVSQACHLSNSEIMLAP